MFSTTAWRGAEEEAASADPSRAGDAAAAGADAGAVDDRERAARRRRPQPAESAAPAPAAPPTPPPAPMTTPEPTPSKANVDLDALNREYNQLRDDLFRSRAKSHLLGDALFKTKIVATFQYKAQRAWPIKKVTLKSTISRSSPSTRRRRRIRSSSTTASPRRASTRSRCASSAAPPAKIASPTAPRARFVIDVAENKQSNVAFVVDETGDGPQKIAKKREGTFDVRVRADLGDRGAASN